MAVRQKMIASRYPEITEEETTVDFIIFGLQKTPQLTPILGNLIINKPTSIKDFTRKYKLLHDIYQPVHGQTPAPPPLQTGQYIRSSSPHQPTQAPNQLPYFSNFRYRRPYRGQYRRPYFTTRRALPQNQMPCSFHTSLGIPAQHSDAECRDPRHPKNKHVKTQAHYTQAQYPYDEYPHLRMQPTLAPEAQPITTAIPRDNNTEADREADGKFILDSGAHPTHITRPMPNMTPTTTPTLTNTANNQQSICTHSGTITITPTKSNHTLQTYTVANGHIKHNLLSVNDLANRYGLVTFTGTTGTIYNTKTNPPQVMATAQWKTNGYELTGILLPTNAAYGARIYKHKSYPKTKPRQPQNTPSHNNIRQNTKGTKPKSNPPPLTNTTPFTTTTNHLPALTNTAIRKYPSNMQQKTHDWHIKLNHANVHKLSLTAKSGLIPTMPKSLPTNLKITCNACNGSKQHPAAHKLTTHLYAPGAYISSDTCGPVKPTSTHGNNHILILICAASRYAFAHFLKDRKDIPEHINKTLQHIRQRHGQALQHFRTDNAKEHLSSTMKTIYNTHGVTHHLRTPHQPQENSIAERINRTIMESARALLRTAKLDERYWEDAARDTILKYNMLHHDSINTSPYKKWHGINPKMAHIYTFGQLGTVPVYAPKKKLDARAEPARYMYPTSLTNIVVLNLKNQQYQQIRATDFQPYHKEQDPTNTTTVALRTKTKYTQSPPQHIDINTPPPTSLNHARKYPDADKWGQAHDAELQNLDLYNSIKWLPRDFKPPPEAVIPLMMLYKYKQTDDGTTLQRKARCNLRGDLMKPGLHYDPRNITTYTADRSSQRLLLALHATYQMPVEHFDIKAAYLHEKYEHHRPVYVKQMPKFDGSYTHESTYGQLTGNLYGSPPGAYYYNKGLQKFLKTLGYHATEHDPCLYVKHTDSGTILASTTIDDFLVTATRQTHIDELYSKLLTKYRAKRLGKPRRFLNWTIQQQPNGSIHISQPDTIDAILKQTNMSDCNPTKTPYSTLSQLHNQDTSEQLNAKRTTRYRKVLGEIRYITDSTRPDIAYITNTLAQHMSAPTTQHEQTLKTLLRYLKGTRTYGLPYASRKKTEQHNHPLSIYSDADFANAKDRKSVSGNVHFLGTTPISWHSKKQNVVALSTTEAEYIAATNATQHTKWIQKLLHEIKITPEAPSPHHIDNRSAIIIAENKAPTKRRKYIDLRHHYLQHHITEGRIALHRVPTGEMKADILTKPLPRERFETLRSRLQVVPPHQQEAKCEAATGDCQST